MRNRWLAALVAAALAVGLLGVPSAAAVAPRPSNVLHVGQGLATGSYLRSANEAYTAAVSPWGRLVLRHRGALVWVSPSPVTSHARLALRPFGDLVLMSGNRMLWHTNTGYSRATALVMTDAGILQLQSPGGTVWSDEHINRCAAGAANGKRVLVYLGAQFARLCNHATQLLTTPITSGASAYGNATPTGTWWVQSKQRDRYLYPASGGAYYVHYWLPYDGAYGMHDSPWQRFPYGSALYRTRGSHGCVHFPAAAIAWMYGWARIGTIVHIQS